MFYRQRQYFFIESTFWSLHLFLQLEKQISSQSGTQAFLQVPVFFAPLVRTHARACCQEPGCMLQSCLQHSVAFHPHLLGSLILLCFNKRTLLCFKKGSGRVFPLNCTLSVKTGQPGSKGEVMDRAVPSPSWHCPAAPSQKGRARMGMVTRGAQPGSVCPWLHAAGGNTTTTS